MPAENTYVLSWPAIVLAAVTASSASTGLHGIAYDSLTPDFWLPPAHGDAHDLYSLRGRVVVINFWATWCHACIDEMPYFVAAKQQFGNRVAVVTISEEPPTVAATYFRENGINLTLVEDPEGAIQRQYDVEKFPITLVLDPAGKVSYVSVGGLSRDELLGAITSALGVSEDSPSTPAPRVLR